jgi:hypothetical protein
MKKYIFINYFSDKDPTRREEYIYCVKQNLACDFIDKVFIFVENESCKQDLPQSEKISFLHIPARMEFNDVIKYTHENLEDGSIIIILNLDIFIENSSEWANIDRDFFQIGHDKKAMALCRHNLTSLSTCEIESDSWITGHFCDGWVFQTPLEIKFVEEDLKFCLGTFNCDNLMMYLMSKYYHTFSWGSKYKIYHLDISRKLSVQDKNKLSTKSSVAAQRKDEHYNIPAFQNWSFLLKNQIAPEYRKTWIKCFNQNNIFYVTYP